MTGYTLCIEGEIDVVSAPLLRQDIVDMFELRPANVDIDFVDATFMDCAGVNVLIELRGLLASKDHELRLRHLGRHVRRPIDVLGLADFLNVEEPTYRKLDDSCASESANAPGIL